MTKAQERLFAYMGGREAYDKMYRLYPSVAARWEAQYTPEFDAAPERDVSQDNASEVAAHPDEYRCKEYVIRDWAKGIRLIVTELFDDDSAEI